MNRHDISKEKKPTLAETIFGKEPNVDPAVSHNFRLPLSIKERIKAIGNKNFLVLLNKVLPKTDTR